VKAAAAAAAAAVAAAAAAVAAAAELNPLLVGRLHVKIHSPTLV
jgi:hypothetical protein